MAHTDGLTSLLNRRYFEFLAEQHIQKSQDLNYPLTLLLLDVDHFKKINDGYGHDVGDEILKLISHITSQNIRKQDILARFGGEEFIVLLTDTHADQGKFIADHICNEIAKFPYIVSETDTVHFTISIGVAQFSPKSHNLRALIKSADLALYTAKQQGRNRVVKHHHSM